MKVDSALYESHLRDDLLPACNDMYPEGNFIFVQDGAPSHTAKKCQEFLRQELGDQFVDKLNWPPYSPDCNPLYYFFLNELSNKVYQGRTELFRNIAELEIRILDVWEGVTDLPTLQRSIDQFLPRLRAVVQNDGRSIKTFFVDCVTFRTKFSVVIYFYSVI